MVALSSRRGTATPVWTRTAWGAAASACAMLALHEGGRRVMARHRARASLALVAASTSVMGSRTMDTRPALAWAVSVGGGCGAGGIRAANWADDSSTTADVG